VTRACAAPTSNPDNKLRASVLLDPAGARKNSRDNTPAVVHYEIVPGHHLEVICAAKGGGSENKSKFYALNPSDSIVDWVLKTVPTMGAGWCPPGILGIGIGGTPEKAMLLAKESLMAPVDIHELIERGAQQSRRGTAPRALRKGQRAGHRRAGPRRPDHRPRRQDPRLPDACREPAGGDDPQLCRHPPRALPPRWLRTGGPDATGPRRMAQGQLDAEHRDLDTGQPRHADAGRGRCLEAGPDPAAQRQDADRPRCSASTHPGDAGQGTRNCRSTSPTA
jgi:hypothetical protein